MPIMMMMLMMAMMAMAMVECKIYKRIYRRSQTSSILGAKMLGVGHKDHKTLGELNRKFLRFGELQWYELDLNQFKLFRKFYFLIFFLILVLLKVLFNSIGRNLLISTVQYIFDHKHYELVPQSIGTDVDGASCTLSKLVTQLMFVWVLMGSPLVNKNTHTTTLCVGKQI